MLIPSRSAESPSHVGRAGWLAIGYVAISVIGAVHAVRHARPARFGGLRLPGTALTHAMTVGTPLSAHPAMLCMFVFATWRQRSAVVGALCILALVGIAGEPDTWSLVRHRPDDAVSAACVALEAALPIAMLLENR